MTDRLTEIKARANGDYYVGIAADLEYAMEVIERLTAERDEWRKQTGIGVHSQFSEGVQYEKKLDSLRSALLLSPCPRPIGDDETVADCLKSCNCGCDNRAALGDKP